MKGGTRGSTLHGTMTVELDAGSYTVQSSRRVVCLLGATVYWCYDTTTSRDQNLDPVHDPQEMGRDFDLLKHRVVQQVCSVLLSNAFLSHLFRDQIGWHVPRTST